MTFNNKQVDFGFEKVNYLDKQKRVEQVFSSVVQKYDLMNDLMSFGIHRLWKDYLVKQLDSNKSLVDVASGTADIAKLYYQKCTKPDIILTDINIDMLSFGKNKLLDLGIYQGLKFSVADAENLPFASNCFDYYTIAFGIRNVTNPLQAIREAKRVLKPGGKFLCLEFSSVNNIILQKLYDFYSLNIIPKIGGLISSDVNSYKYLVESIKVFKKHEAFISIMEEAGLKVNKYVDLTRGIASLYTGYKA